MSADQAIKEPCRVATAANITLSGLQTIDGVTTVAGDRVLVRAQTSAVANGLYVAASGAWSRATDFDGAGEVVGGTQVAVTSGTDRAGSAWRVAGAGPIVIGTDPIPFERAYDSESVTFLQAGTGAVQRSAEDKLRDCLDVRDFGADPTGGDSTAAFQAACAEAIASGRALRIPAGSYVLTDTLFTLASNCDTLHIFGDGMAVTELVNQTVGVPLFLITSARWCTISDLAIIGNDLTEDGNGHAIALLNPGTIGTTTFYPLFTRLERLIIRNHRGMDLAYGGAAMPACAVYMAGSLGDVLDNCWISENGFGLYAHRSAQPEIRTCTFVDSDYAALVNDQCENFRLSQPDVVGDNTQKGGTIKVGAAGSQSSGVSVRAGAVVDFFGSGSLYLGGKFKNHRYSAFSLHSPLCPLVTGAWMRQEIDGCIGVYNAYGARVIANEFSLGGICVRGTRTGVKFEALGGYSDFGIIDQNEFTYGGDRDYGTSIEIDASGASFVSGTIRGNKAGAANGLSEDATLDAFIKITGLVRKIVVADNHVTAPENLTVTVAYDYGGVTTQIEEGLIDSGNSSWNAFGAGIITTVKDFPAGNAYTGLQANGKLNVNALTVQGDQVVGARDTGWTAATGTAAKGAYATYAGQTISDPFVAAEVQATDNAVKALSQRFKALEDAVRAHGLID